MCMYPTTKILSYIDYAMRGIWFYTCRINTRKRGNTKQCKLIFLFSNWHLQPLIKFLRMLSRFETTYCFPHNLFYSSNNKFKELSFPGYPTWIFLREDTVETNITSLKKNMLDALWLDRSVLFVLWWGRMNFSNAETTVLLVWNIFTICSLHNLKCSALFLLIIKNESESESIRVLTSKFLCKPLPIKPSCFF